MELLNSILYDTVYHSAPIILCVIGGIFAYKANVLNIALEGMMLNGAFISVLVEYLTGSVALAVIAAIVTTLLWGLVFSFLGITCNGNVIVIGLGINLIVPAIAKFVLKVMELANISLQDVGVADFKINIPGIKSIPLIGGIVSGHPVITYLAFIGIAAAAILMYKTKFGIYVRVVGENEDSAISLGLKTQKYKYIAVLIGAFCCALAGINLSMERMAMFTSDMTAGRGFIAIAAIYCGQGKPVQSSLYAILFGVARSLELVNVMNETVQQMGKRYLNGLNCTMDGFYSCMHDSKFSLECGRDMSKTFEEVKKLGVTGIDMESSCILTLGRLMGVKTCILTVVTVLENLKETLKGQDRVDAEDLLCRTALEGIYNYHIKREDGKNE